MRLRRSLEERFWEKVLKSSGCWLWTASVDKDGYGQIMVRVGSGTEERITMGKSHRVSMAIHGTPIPSHLVCRHLCGNPRCVNPKHLVPGTSKENGEDTVRMGNSTRGSKNPMSKLSPTDVREIRKLRQEGKPLKELAKMYSVAESCISRVSNKTRWRHL